VSYTVNLLGRLRGLKATLLHVIHTPEEDFFPSPAERQRWINVGRKNVDRWMQDYRLLLIDGGWPPDDVRIRVVERDGPSLAQMILYELAQLNAGTVVVGRQGLSRKEEFLFGSVSKQIVSHTRDCTVWVVQ